MVIGKKSYRRYVITICLGIGALIIYTSYTSVLRHDFPLCSMLTWSSCHPADNNETREEQLDKVKPELANSGKDISKSGRVRQQAGKIRKDGGQAGNIVTINRVSEKEMEYSVDIFKDPLHEDNQSRGERSKLQRSSEDITKYASINIQKTKPTVSRNLRRPNAVGSKTGGPEYLILDAKWAGKTLDPLLKDTTSLSLQTDYDYLQHHLYNGGLNLSMLSQQEWDVNILDFEKDLLRDPPLEDVTRSAAFLSSKVVLLNPKPTYRIGDTVWIRVDLFNGRGEALRRGGDEVRVWLVERSKNAAVAGSVVDFRNGSYATNITLQWTGVQMIQAEITYPREAIRVYFYLRYVIKNLRFVAGGFANAELSESTLCSTFPLIPGYPKLCNFTDPVYGLRWFCGQPRKQQLSCRDWVSIRDMEYPQPLPVTHVEETLLSRLNQGPLRRLIPNTFALNVTNGTPRAPNTPCSSKKFRGTWQLSKPRGFMLHGQWIRTDCLPTQLNPVVELECLRNRTLVLAGDSNLLTYFSYLIRRTGCRDVENYSPSLTWHKPRLCVREDINFRMTWSLHGNPAHAMPGHWAMKSDFQEVTDVLRTIPSKGRFIVLIHLFIHFSIHHYSVFVNRMKAAKMEVANLVQRNPDAIVVIRGPHIATFGSSPHLGGDIMGPLMRELTVGIFKKLRDHVLFLDFWDMTIAMENPNFHPPESIQVAMINVLLQHVCSSE